MDKILEKKKGLALVFSRKALPWWLGALLLIFILWVALRDNASTLRVNSDTLNIASVEHGEFNDYIRVSGQVQPMTTIQLSPLEGGVVEQIFIEEGSQVRKGDVILRLSNENLDLQILNSEAELAEKENILRNTMISMEQQKLSVQQERLQLEMEVRRYRRAYEQQKALYDEKLIARETYLQAEEDWQLAEDKLNLVRNRELQDSLYRSVEIEQMEESLENMRMNMQMIRRRKDNLDIKAPIDGELGLLDAVLGQSIASGTKIGQINDLSSYKIEAQIDEHYIDRVSAGLDATFERQDDRLQVQRTAAREHTHRTDLLPEPPARTARRGGDDPAWQLLPADGRAVDLRGRQERRQGRAPRHTHRPAEPPVLRSAGRPQARREGDNLRLRQLRRQGRTGILNVSRR